MIWLLPTFVFTAILLFICYIWLYCSSYHPTNRLACFHGFWTCFCLECLPLRSSHNSLLNIQVSTNWLLPARTNYAKYIVKSSSQYLLIPEIIFYVYDLYPYPMLALWKWKLLSCSHLYPLDPEHPSCNINSNQIFFDRLTKVSIRIIRSILYFPLWYGEPDLTCLLMYWSLHREGQRRNKSLPVLLNN